MTNAIGDLAHNIYTTRRSVALKSEVYALTEELSTGKVRDVSAHLGADQAYYGEVESRLTRLDAFDLAAGEAELFGEAAQVAIGRLQEMSNGLAQDAIITANSGLAQARSQQSNDAAADLELMISTINGQIAGRSLFSGISTDTTPLNDAETMLTAVRAEIAGLSDPADVLAAVQTWFSDPAGFDAVMYNGSAQPLAPVQVSEDVSVGYDLRANDPSFKAALQMAVVAVISDDPGVALSNNQRMDLMQEAGTGLLAATASLAETSGSLGATQARVETAAVRNAATRTSLEIARTELVSADPYEVSVRLEELQVQLEALFAVTARNSRLTLTNFL